MLLDCYEYCTEEYRKELDGPRAAAAAIDSKRIEASRASKAQVCSTRMADVYTGNWLLCSVLSDLPLAAACYDTADWQSWRQGQPHHKCTPTLSSRTQPAQCPSKAAAWLAAALWQRAVTWQPCPYHLNESSCCLDPDPKAVSCRQRRSTLQRLPKTTSPAQPPSSQPLQLLTQPRARMEAQQLPQMRPCQMQMPPPAPAAAVRTRAK